MIFDHFFKISFQQNWKFHTLSTKRPTCVSTAPWRVDWGLTLSKSLQNYLIINSKNILETRPCKIMKKYIFGQLFEGGFGMIFENICWMDQINVPCLFLAEPTVNGPPFSPPELKLKDPLVEVLIIDGFEELKNANGPTKVGPANFTFWTLFWNSALIFVRDLT